MSFTKEQVMVDYLRNVHRTAKSIQRGLEQRFELKEVKLTVAGSSKDVAYHYTVMLVLTDGKYYTGMSTNIDEAVNEAVAEVEKQQEDADNE